MKAQMRNILLQGMLFACATTSLSGSLLMKGDPQAVAGESFSFPIGLQAYYRSSYEAYQAKQSAWFVAATQVASDATAASYSLSTVAPGEAAFSPLLTETVITINGESGQPNPLRGASFQALGVLGVNPVVARSDAERSRVYILLASLRPPQIWTVLNTDNNEVPGEIIALTTNERTKMNFDSTDVIALVDEMGIVTGIRPIGKPFGDPGSCLGLNLLARKKEGEDKVGPLELVFMGRTPLDKNSTLLQINAPVASMEDHVELSYDVRVAKLFVGVNLVGGPGVADGVDAVLVRNGLGLKDQDLMQIVDPAFVQADAIVAARGSSVRVAAYQLRVMHTTTGLPYLLVNGGIGDDALTHRSVYALPILNASGQLASVRAAPVTIYQNGVPQQSIWLTPPASPADLYSTQSVPARVGGGPLPAPLASLFTFGDAIFASTSALAEEAAPGLWHSRAIFQSNGAIISWTPWRRAGGAQAAVPIYGFALDVRVGEFWFTTGESIDKAKIARKNKWNNGGGMSTLITQLFASVPSSVQGVVELAGSDEQIPLLAATGYQSVALVQADESVESVTVPRLDFNAGFTTTNGSLQGFAEGVSWVMSTGGSLQDAGALLSTAVATNEEYGWIVVAGTQGVLVLADENGAGWLRSPGLGNGFTGLTQGMSWRMLPLQMSGAPLRGIRKIVFDSGRVYILANAGLFAFTPSPALFAPQAQSLEVTPLFTVSSFSQGLSGSCADCYIRGPLALVATSSGLFRSGTGVDIRTVDTVEVAHWTAVKLPYNAGPVGQIFEMGIASHADNEGFDANVMILASYVGLHQAKVYRIAIQTDGAVTDDTVRLFFDQIAWDATGPFFPVGDYRNGVVTDGALLAFSRSRYRADAPYFEFMTPEWTLWPRSLRLSLLSVRLAYDAVTSPVAFSIYPGLVSAVSGAWLVYGDRGLTSNE